MKLLHALKNSYNRVNLWPILLIIIVCTFFAALVPPFESPDENEHVQRAYLFGQGNIILGVTPGQTDSGGRIDTGLIAYRNAFAAFPYRADQSGVKLTAEDIKSAKKITWTGIKEFRPLAAIARYFPVIYFPQATALMLGEKLGLTVNTSYYLARFTAIIAIAVILMAAFIIYPINPLTVALLIMPMSVYQYSSATLDGISSALAIFCIATFLRITTTNKTTNSWLYSAFALSVVLVAASRVQLLPLLGLLLVACFYTKNKRHFYIFTIALVAVSAWLVAATFTTVGGTLLTDGESMTTIALFYIKNPFQFFHVLIATLSKPDYLTFYQVSFFVPPRVMITAFSSHIFQLLCALYLLLGMLSFSAKKLRIDWWPRLTLILGGLASILLVFFLLLLQWNRHPAQWIDGVQGRYFLIPAIMFAYAISGGLKPFEGTSRKIAFLLIIFLGEFYIFSMSKALIDHFYFGSAPQYLLRVSPKLTQKNPITLIFDKKHINNAQSPLQRVGIQIGTYIHINSGTAALKLVTAKGQQKIIPFNLSELSDNHYKFFNVDLQQYASGQIIYLSGGGISTWESRDKNAVASTCMAFEYVDGRKEFTNGCSMF